MSLYCEWTAKLAHGPLADSSGAGNVDDRTPVPAMVTRLRGKLIGDRGSLSAPLTALLFEQGLHFITRLRKHRKNRLMHLSETARASTGDH